MSSLITIDPGLTGTGVACWENGELTGALTITALRAYGDDPVVAISTLVSVAGQYSAKAVVEMPQTYRGRAALGDANDLITLAILVGAIRRVLHDRGLSVQLVTPREWKGNLPKNVTEARCREKLSGEELARVTLPRGKKQQADLWDAIGIGLWVLRR